MIYNGHWKKVIDDDSHILERGARMAVCDKTFQIYSAKRHPRESKGLEDNLTDLSGKCAATAEIVVSKM